MICRYETGDEQYIAQIYHDAIGQPAARVYTGKQSDAWVNPLADAAASLD